jgi:uncharacterized cupin superfamily protein
MADEPTFSNIDLPDTERFKWLAKELGVTTFGLNVMNLSPGQRGRIHRHRQQEEVYIVLEGELTLSIKGEERTLVERDVVRVPPPVRRQLINRGSTTCSLLALGGSQAHNSRDAEAFDDWSDTNGKSPSEVPTPEDLPLD